VLAERSSDIHAAFAIALERGRDHLRLDAGLSYAVGGSYIPLDGRQVHITLGADCMDPEAASVRDALLTTLDELAGQGPTAEELEWDRAQMLRTFSDPAAIISSIDSNARDLLAGVDPASAETIIRERDELTPQSIAEATAAALESLLAIVPVGVLPSGDRFTDYEVGDRAQVEGTHHAATEDARAMGETSQMILGADGITYLEPTQDYLLTVRWDDCLGIIPMLSGTISVVSRHGPSIRVYPYRYEHGDTIPGHVARMVPGDRFVPLTDRERVLQPIVQRELGRPEIANLDREIDALPAILTWDEQLLHLAQVVHDGLLGLFVLTDARALYVPAGLPQDKFREYQRAVLGPPAVKGTFRKRLVLATPDGEVELQQVAPPGRMDQLVAAMSQQPAGVQA
jgi:hypothetical protein